MTLHHLIIRQVTAWRIEHLLLASCSLLLEYAIKNRYGRIGRTIVVTPHHRFIVSIGTNNGNTLLFVERQDAVVVLQQHDALARHV